MSEDGEILCPTCGAKVPADSASCPYCGTILGEAETLELPAEMTLAPEVPAQAPPAAAAPEAAVPASPAPPPPPTSPAPPAPMPAPPPPPPYTPSFTILPPPGGLTPQPPPVEPRERPVLNVEGPVEVRRRVSFDLRIPREMVDTNGYLTDEQWEQLLAAYHEDLTRYARQQQDLGRAVDLGQALLRVPLPWDRAGVRVATPYRQDIEQRLVDIAEQVEQLPPTLQSVVDVAATTSYARRQQTLTGCLVAIGIVFFLILLMVIMRGG